MQKNSMLRIALAQINSVVGDLQGNFEKIDRHVQAAKASGCHLVAFPELTITGYPPEDLVLRQQFLQDQKEVLYDIVAQIEGIICIVGFVDIDKNRRYNSAAVLQNRTIKAVYHKIHLPNYSVFDEERYFEAGKTPMLFSLNGVKIGLSICEDIWIPDSVIETQVFDGGAEMILNISASPYSIHKSQERLTLMQSRAKKTHSVVAYVNLIGGQDELVFDGQSLIIGPHGNIRHAGIAFEEELIIHDIDVDIVRQSRNDPSFIQNKSSFKAVFPVCQRVTLDDETTPTDPAISTSIKIATLSFEEEIYKALLLGLHDYVHKNNFSQAVFGLSGGIDSALVATLAADALGPENVYGITMPSQYSSQGSVDDSIQLAQNCAINLKTFPIKDVFLQYLELFQETFAEREADVTEENLQARIRGNIVMALSNKFGWLALATGNKSEVSVGYCTIYGDMVGGFAPLKDVTKTMVYRLANYRNYRAGYDLIPQEIIDKAPSAELRPDQKDQDSLPPYDELDELLELYVEKRMSIVDIIAHGYKPETVQKIARLVDFNEYKRRQAAPGIKITPLAFGKDRRMPITCRYQER
ncbi:NAD+ synthase [candidate division KSB1 bacterium]|nr:NAD+ synthase [candidate division KSB1 bacterium]RQW00226.1 MAG: NAD+ synthase [candidate division KSB1 bacterium]